MQHSTDGRKNPRILTYAMAITELIIDSEGQKKKLLEEKFDALKKSWSLLEMYARDGFDEKTLDTIMEKKARLILGATSIQDGKPYYNGGKWTCSKNSVPEEEMIWWSKTSLRVPLVPEAVDRYVELFKQFYGMSISRKFAMKD